MARGETTVVADRFPDGLTVQMVPGSWEADAGDRAAVIRHRLTAGAFGVVGERLTS